MLATCPGCKEKYDPDDFDGGMPVFWYCSCGAIIVKTPFGFIEIPEEEVDLGRSLNLPGPDLGRFIEICRWKKVQWKIKKVIAEAIKELCLKEQL